MQKISTKKIVMNGLAIALVFIATMVIRFPITTGYFNLGDTMIMIVAVVIGRSTGLFSGAIGSCLADIASGYFIYAPVTFVVKGIEGFVIGSIALSKQDDKRLLLRRVIAIVIGAIIMVIGYFLAETYVLGFLDKTFGLTTAIANFVPNLVQGAISAVVAMIISSLLEKANIKKYLE